MRILVATDQWFPDRMGGVARVATDTGRGWAGRGHEVLALAPEHPGEPRSETHGSLRVLRVLPRGRLPQTITDRMALRRSLPELEAGFDVAVAHGATVGAGLLDSRPDVPLVYAFHASAAAEARYLRSCVRPGREWLAAALFEALLRRWTTRMLREAAAIVVLSEFTRRIVHDLSPEAAARAVLVPGAVDTSAFTPEGREEAREALGISPSTKLVFTVRRLEPRMGLENLVAAAGLLADLPDLRVAIAGGGGGGDDLAALRARLGLEGRVALVGRVSDEELRQWHRAADLFVLPTVAYEGFGLVTIEALASGTPVIGTPIGATPELLEPLEPRLVSRGTDPATLAEAIRAGLALATPALRERCRAHAVERFSWDTALEHWEAALVDAAPTRRPASAIDALEAGSAGR